MRKNRFDLLRQYALAAALIGIASAIIKLMPLLQAHGMFSIFMAAVCIVAWKGGFGPAIFATVLSMFVGSWYFLPPYHSLHINEISGIVRLSSFTLLSLLISSLQTARTRAETMLQESEHRLGFTLQSAGVGCWDADLDAGTFWHSPNLPIVFGRSPEKFTTTAEGFFFYIHPEDRDFYRLASLRTAADSLDYEIAHRIFHEDGSQHRVMTHGRMYLSQQGKVCRMVGSVYALEPSESIEQAPAVYLADELTAAAV